MTDQMAEPIGAAGPAGYDPEYPVNGTDEPGRHAALAAATSNIRGRSRISVEQILLISASVLFPLGLVFIVLGWYGAAHTGRTYAQLDYLISGGLLGVGVSAAGGFLYFGYWLSRQLGESRRQNAATLAALQRIQATLEGQPANGAPSFAPPAGWTPPPATETSAGNGGGRRRAKRPAPQDDATGEVAIPALYATSRGSLLHRQDCPVLANRSGLKAVAAGTEGYSYCTMCNAAGAVASPPPPASPGG